MKFHKFITTAGIEVYFAGMVLDKDIYATLWEYNGFLTEV